MLQTVSVRFRLLRGNASLPAYAHGSEEDAGMDLIFAPEYEYEYVTLGPGERHVFETGLSMELPPGYEGQVRSRSGLAAKYGLFVLNSPGTIDPSYRGEIKVILQNGGQCPYTVRAGDKIAQFIIAAYVGVVAWELGDLTTSNRGSNGIGSTGDR